MLRAIVRYFPADTRVTRPRGGYFLWLELPGIDGEALYRACLGEGVSIAPGALFAANDALRSCTVAAVGRLVSERHQ